MKLLVPTHIDWKSQKVLAGTTWFILHYSNHSIGEMRIKKWTMMIQMSMRSILSSILAKSAVLSNTEYDGLGIQSLKIFGKRSISWTTVQIVSRHSMNAIPTSHEIYEKYNKATWAIMGRAKGSNWQTWYLLSSLLVVFFSCGFFGNKEGF